jgi:hypothetical protein
MKVMCIKLPKSISPACKGKVNIKIGVVYTVLRDLPEFLTPNCSGPCYELAEDRGYAHVKTLFAPISDIDETEMIREYKTQTV